MPTATKAAATAKRGAPKRRASATPRRTHNDQKARPQIGLRLSQLMAEGGLSQEQLEAESGINQYTISRLKNGHHTARPETTRDLAAAFSRILGRVVTVEYLQGGQGVAGLGMYLQSERRRRSLTLEGMASVLGLNDAGEIASLEAARFTPSAYLLGRILGALPLSYPIVLDALLEIGGYGAHMEGGAGEAGGGENGEVPRDG